MKIYQITFLEDWRGIKEGQILYCYVHIFGFIGSMHVNHYGDTPIQEGVLESAAIVEFCNVHHESKKQLSNGKFFFNETPKEILGKVATFSLNHVSLKLIE